MRQLPFVRRAPRALVVGVLAGGSFMLVAACGAEVTLPSTGSPSTSSGGASGSSGNSSGASGTAPGESDSGTTSGGLSIALGVSKLDLPVPGVAKVRVRVARTGWNGEVKLDLASAPNGVTAASVTVPAGSSEGDLVLQSAIILPPGAMATVRATGAGGNATAPLDISTATARLDSSFGTGGDVELPMTVSGMLPMVDGSVLVHGTYVHRVTADGQLDSSFGTGGRSVVYGGPLAITPNGEILVLESGGHSANVLVVSRLQPNGTVDTMFGTAGKVQIAVPNSAYKQFDGRAIVAAPDGTFWVSGSLRPTVGAEEGAQSFVSHHLASGALDVGFASGGIEIGIVGATRSSHLLRVGTDVYDFASRPVPGFSAFEPIVRSRSQLGLTTSFGTGGVFSLNSPGVAPEAGSSSASPFYEGKVLPLATGFLMYGRGGFHLARKFTSAGSLDTAYGDSGAPSFGTVWALPYLSVREGELRFAADLGGRLHAIAANRDHASPGAVRFDSTGNADPLFAAAGVLSLPIYKFSDLVAFEATPSGHMLVLSEHGNSHLTRYFP